MQISTDSNHSFSEVMLLMKIFIWS